MKKVSKRTLACLLTFAFGASAQENAQEFIVEPGHPSLEVWLLPDVPPAPSQNEITQARVELGKALFFDPGLSANQAMSCATCHNPALGWADGQAFSKGVNGNTLARTSPSMVNMAFNDIYMWDGRVSSIEEQVLGPITSPAEMNVSLEDLEKIIGKSPTYKKSFDQAYPGEKIDSQVIGKALASFVRTVVSNESAFDRWVKGDASAMSEGQVNGFKLFVDEQKGNCVACHHPPNFTDNGFHNIGLPVKQENMDPGRFALKPLPLMKGAFKTPTLRDIALTAPYFHDGSAASLQDVMRHYVEGGDKNGPLSPNMKPLELSDAETADLIRFMEALTSSQSSLTSPSIAMGLKRE